MKLSFKVMISTTMSIVLLLSGIVNLSVVYAEEEETQNDEIDINIDPKDVLFDVTNMKPGDWAPRTVTVHNDGSSKFEYVTKIEPTGDSLKLFNELVLEVKDSNEELYNGKLKDFAGLGARALSPNEAEELEFTVRFPEQLGNEFQGLNAQFNLIFTAEGAGRTTDEADVVGAIGSGGDSGLSLPNTATNIFNFLLIGVLILLVGTSILVLQRKFKRLE